MRWFWRSRSIMRLNAAESSPISSPVVTVIDWSRRPASTSRVPCKQPQHGLRDAAADHHREYKSEQPPQFRSTIAEIQIACRCSWITVAALDIHLLQHVGADALDLAVKFLAQRVGMRQRALRSCEIPGIELLQQHGVLLVQAMAEIGDRGVDAVVEPSKRGIVRWRRSIVDDRDDLRARGLCLAIDIAIERLEGLSDAPHNSPRPADSPSWR